MKSRSEERDVKRTLEDVVVIGHDARGSVRRTKRKSLQDGFEVVIASSRRPEADAVIREVDDSKGSPPDSPEGGLNLVWINVHLRATRHESKK